MPLTAEEIVPGAVAILETEPLMKNKAVRRAEDDSPFRAGPFVCVQVKDGQCTWLNITTQKDKRGIRLELKQEWLLEGSDKWRSAPQYVHDARKPFIGPVDAFVEAGAKELPHQPHKRPRVSTEAVEAALAEMKKYRAPVL